MSYVKAANLQEALNLLKTSTPRPRVIAGGTDLFLQDWPGCLIDISFLDDLKIIEEKDEVLEIGSGVTHAMAAGQTWLNIKRLPWLKPVRRWGHPRSATWEPWGAT